MNRAPGKSISPGCCGTSTKSDTTAGSAANTGPPAKHRTASAGSARQAPETRPVISPFTSIRRELHGQYRDRKGVESGKDGAVSVALGGRGTIKKKTHNQDKETN